MNRLWQICSLFFPSLDCSQAQEERIHPTSFKLLSPSTSLPVSLIRPPGLYLIHFYATLRLQPLLSPLFSPDSIFPDSSEFSLQMIKKQIQQPWCSLSTLQFDQALCSLLTENRQKSKIRQKWGLCGVTALILTDTISVKPFKYIYKKALLLVIHVNSMSWFLHFMLLSQNLRVQMICFSSNSAVEFFLSCLSIPSIKTLNHNLNVINIKQVIIYAVISN